MNYRVKIYFYFNKLIVKFTNLIIAIHEGFWLGLLDGDKLNEITTSYYRSSKYQKNLDLNLWGLVLWEERLVDNFFKNMVLLVL